MEILDEDLHDLYLRADDTIRRLINQAIFNALFVCDETIATAKLAGPFAEIRALHNAIRGIARTPIPASMAELPDDWQVGDDGKPAPNWVAALHRSRSGH